MRKNIRFIVCLLVLLFVFWGQLPSVAQNSQQMLQEGKEWFYRSVYGPRGADINYYCKISGDTLVGDVSILETGQLAGQVS